MIHFCIVTLFVDHTKRIISVSYTHLSPLLCCMPSFYAHCARHAHYFGFAHLDFVSFFSGSFELPHQEYWTQQRCLYLNPRTEAPPFGCSTSDHTPPSCGLFSDSYTTVSYTHLPSAAAIWRSVVTFAPPPH